MSENRTSEPGINPKMEKEAETRTRMPTKLTPKYIVNLHIWYTAVACLGP